MGQADEIERLAGLRDRGVLSEKEFNRAKAKILNGGRAPPSRFMTAVAALVAIMIMAGFLSKFWSSYQAEAAPSPAPAATSQPVVAQPAEPAPATGPEAVEPDWDDPVLACDLIEVKDKVTELVNRRSSRMADQMGAADLAHMIQIQGLGATTELHRVPESGFIACVANTLHPKGEGVVGYTVGWTDRNIGQFWVELADADSLKEQYDAAE